MTTSRTGTIREWVRLRPSAPCAKCNIPMRWMGFDVRDHGATFLHYKCEKCGRMGTKMLSGPGEIATHVRVGARLPGSRPRATAKRN